MISSSNMKQWAITGNESRSSSQKGALVTYLVTYSRTPKKTSAALHTQQPQAKRPVQIGFSMVGCTFFLTKNLITSFSHHHLLHGHIRHIVSPTTFLSHLRGCTSPNSAPFLPHSNKRPGVHLHPAALLWQWPIKRPSTMMTAAAPAVMIMKHCLWWRVTANRCVTMTNMKVTSTAQFWTNICADDNQL